MMKKIILFLGIFLANISMAWDIKGVGNFKFEKLNKQVFVMHGPLTEPNVKNHGFMNNPAIIVAKNSVIVVDPGSTYPVGKMVLKEIEKITKKPIVAVFNTHVHGDHWLANHAIVKKYPKVKIYANPKMIKHAKNGEGKTWLDLMNNYTNGHSKKTEMTLPNIAVSNQTKLVIDNETFIIHLQTKAHTNTDIMIEHADSKTLFLGDNNFAGRLGRFDATSSIYGNIKALKLAKGLKLDFFVPGHGQSGNYKNAVAPFANFLNILEAETKKGYNNDLADYEIKKTIMDKTKKYHHWVGFEEGLGKQVSKMYLEIEENDL